MQLEKPRFLPLYKRLMNTYRRKYRYFLTRLETVKPRGLDKIALEADKEVWQETDCLACANCCKTMTPTFTKADIKRISAHFNQTPQEFTDKWLYKQRGTGDMMNKKQPCQFLDLKTNMCIFMKFVRKIVPDFHITPKNILRSGYMYINKMLSIVQQLLN